MKASVTINGERISLNCERLRTVDKCFSYFYLTEAEVTADLMRNVGEQITGIRRAGDEWQVQVKTDTIEWED